MAGNTPFQVGNGDPEGVKIPNVPLAAFGGTPANQPAIYFNTLPVSGAWTTANVTGLSTLLSNIVGALTTLNLASRT